MPGIALLPCPLAASSLTLGQLIVDPFNPASNSFALSTPSPSNSKTEPKYNEIISQDDEGGLISRVSTNSSQSRDNLLLVQAEHSEHLSLQQPTKSFDALSKDESAQKFFRRISHRNQTLYYVVGIQKLKNPVYKRVAVKDGAITEASAGPKLRLPTHPRRDSGADIDGNTNDNDSVLAVELRKVRCHIGSADEPHSLEDIGFSWNYLRIEDDLQLSIGLGKAVTSAELQALAGIVSGEDFTDRSYENSTDDEDGGVGGF